MTISTTWTIEIEFTEDDDKTRADAFLNGAPVELRGWGRARRNPADPDMPAIGEEIAAARALADLSHHLLDEAAHRIEAWEGHAIRLRQ
jgi:Rv2632c-like